jgi:cytochrome c oxidase subunit IV
MSAHTEHNDHADYDAITYIPKAQSHGTRDIWIKFWVLSGITVLDIFMYFAIDPHPIRSAMFIIFGLIKAFYIVGTFMHLRHELLNLIMIILIPLLFILFFIYWMLYEGNYWGNS